MRTIAFILLFMTPLCAISGALNFTQNQPTQYEFGDQPQLPDGFGSGEFTLEIWIKPDASKPVGPVWRASYAQLENWSDADPQPYSTPGWWLPGNWLLDGHTRPNGFGPNDTREGTFSLQFYGGGRLRWMFADANLDLPGKVYAVQVWPATRTSSLLDGEWHHVAAVRRWAEEGGAILELWIDGERIATTSIPTRTDMRVYWDKLAHPDDPPELGGWAWGSEVMTAWNYTFTQYEDYKGALDELRFWNVALNEEDLRRAPSRSINGNETGLSGWYDFEERTDDVFRDRLDSKQVIRIHRATTASYVDDDAPAS